MCLLWHANKGKDDSSTKVIPTFFKYGISGALGKKKLGITFILE